MSIDDNDELSVGEKPKISGVYETFAQIADALTTDTSRIFALFLLLPLTAIVAFIFAPQTPIVAGAILMLVVIALGMTVYLLRLSGEKQRRSRNKNVSLVSRLIQVGLVGATSLLFMALLNQLGIFAKVFPRFYPENAAVDAVQRYYDRLGQILSANDDQGRALALRDFTHTMTPDFQKRNLPKGCAELIAKLNKTPDDEGLQDKLKEDAKTYVGWFGRANGVYVDLVGTSSWQRIQRSDSRHVLYVLAIVRFSGRFTDNAFPNARMRVGDLALAMNDPTSPQRLQLVRWLEEQFPSLDRSQMDTILGQLYVTDLGEANAFDLAEYRLGKDKVGTRSDSPYRFGNEVSFVSIRLEMDTDIDREWRVAEIGRWGMKRLFTEDPPPSTFSTDRRMVVDAVPYYAQKTPSLCQSACLQMVAERLSEGKTYDQQQIRSSLELDGDPLSHTVRIKWLTADFPAYKWSMRYVKSLPETAAAIRSQLSGGVPVIMSTRLTPSGHVIVITGIWVDSAGETIVRAHDPWGRFDFKTLQYNQQVGVGCDVEYPLAQLYVKNRKWISNDGQSIVSKYIVGTEEWLPPASKQIEQGFGVAATLRDWEFVAGYSTE